MGARARLPRPGHDPGSGTQSCSAPRREPASPAARLCVPLSLPGASHSPLSGLQLSCLKEPSNCHRKGCCAGREDAARARAPSCHTLQKRTRREGSQEGGDPGPRAGAPPHPGARGVQARRVSPPTRGGSCFRDPVPGSPGTAPAPGSPTARAAQTCKDAGDPG